MNKTYRFLFLCLLALMACIIKAQSSHEKAELLFEKFKTAARFDFNFPREKVYIHFDNAAYLTGDTIWYKAYVVRASSLKPTTLSKVLYVELLNADGQNVINQVLKVDSMGMAQGAIPLPDYVYPGFYEVRAFTREMTNWGKYACFSRIFPIFTDKSPQQEQSHDLNLSLSQLSIPLPEKHKKVTFGQPRPYLLTTNKDRILNFYPEGGARAKGVGGRIAFKLTDGVGLPTFDTLSIYYADGRLCTTTQPLHDGMGAFELPADFDNGYALISNFSNRFSLPSCIARYNLSVTENSDEGLTLKIAANDSVCHQQDLLGIAIFNRENACFFDTLTIKSKDAEVFIQRKALRSGVNRIELFNNEGISLATRMVWISFNTNEISRKINIQVKQNKRCYDPFSPIVLTLKAISHDGSSIQNAQLSISVRDEASNLITSTDAGIEASMLLASELRGYIHRPDRYFERNDAAHRLMLDLLMMVQGWQTNSFNIMCQRDSFVVKQPIEEKLLIDGTVCKYNNKKEPCPNTNVRLLGYGYNNTRTGASTIQAQAKTNAKGLFVIEAPNNFYGDYLTTFKLSDGSNKRKWIKLLLNRWFSPALLPFTGLQLNLQPYEYAPQPDSVQYTIKTNQADLFEWKDTLTSYKISELKAAEVITHAKKYKGLLGGRSTWNGGEHYGIKHSTTYFNIQRECEHLRDLGINDIDIFQFFDIMNCELTYDGNDYIINPSQLSKQLKAYNVLNYEADSKRSTSNTNYDKQEEKAFNAKSVEPLSHFEWDGHRYHVLVNNQSPEVFFQPNDDHLCSNFKSASIIKDSEQTDGISGEGKRYSSQKDRLYLTLNSDEYRRQSKRGVESRQIQGFTPETKFYSPNYRKFDIPTDADTRRTLLWVPQIKTDEKGEATLIFFNNSRKATTLDISVRGITKDGQFIDWN